MNALARLDEYLQAAGTPEQSEKPAFSIETREQAIWAMRKIAAIERERKEAQEAAQRETERIKAWLEEEEKRADLSRGYLDNLLEQYHRRELKQNPKAKTIKLPHGALKLRAQQPQFNRDDNVVLNWARKNRPEFAVYPRWVRPDPKLNWAALKSALAIANGKAINPETGEVIPGIEVIEQPEKFAVEVVL